MFCFSQKKRHVERKKAVSPDHQNPQHSIYIDKCTVYTYMVYMYAALVDLDSSGSPGVHPTPGLTSSTQVVCVYVRAYTSTHTPTTVTPAKIEKYTRQTPNLYFRQNIASQLVTSANLEQAETKSISNPPTHTHAGVMKHL